MKSRILIIFFLFLIIQAGCISSKWVIDKTVRNSISSHPERVKEAAAYSIARTLQLHTSNFDSKDIEDKEMRKKVSALGNTVFVAYEEDQSTAISDSCVTFESITPYGTIQIMYDFASRTRTFA